MIDPQEFLRSHPPVLSDGLRPGSDDPQEAGTQTDRRGTGTGAHPSVFRQSSRYGSSSPRRTDGRRHDTGTGEQGSSSQECFDAAVRSLSAADATVSMLRQRLRRKEFSEEDIDQTVTRLVDAGLLDDERFGGDLLERCLRRSMGPAGVRREFRRRGLDGALTDRLIGEAEESGRFDEAARAFVEAFRQEADGLDRQTALRRLASRAANRGLPSGLVRRYAAELLGL